MSTMRIKVSQLVYGDFTKPDHWFAKYVEPINQVYCDLHGYRYVVERRDSVRTDRHGNWEKVSHIQRQLTDCDYLWFMDADCCFYAHPIAIHEELVRMLLPDKLFLGTVCAVDERHRWHETAPECSPQVCNTGVMLIKNTELSRRIVAEWDAVTDTPGFKHLRWQYPLEERGLTQYILPKYGRYIQVHPEYYMMQGTFSYFVRHICCGAGQDREAVFQEMYHSPLMERNRKLREALR